ncbi:MAG: hypothetical protein RAO94_08630 [Candidatus Stygibacter australis]|nr:hypothetical protein [Candidatus Stygibacter australis]MDP8322400.1 hypothetical protein [Candidatus Stygibacter australis]
MKLMKLLLLTLIVLLLTNCEKSPTCSTDEPTNLEINILLDTMYNYNLNVTGVFAKISGESYSDSTFLTIQDSLLIAKAEFTDIDAGDYNMDFRIFVDTDSILIVSEMIDCHVYIHVSNKITISDYIIDLEPTISLHYGEEFQFPDDVNYAVLGLNHETLYSVNIIADINTWAKDIAGVNYLINQNNQNNHGWMLFQCNDEEPYDLKLDETNWLPNFSYYEMYSQLFYVDRNFIVSDTISYFSYITDYESPSKIGSTYTFRFDPANPYFNFTNIDRILIAGDFNVWNDDYDSPYQLIEQIDGIYEIELSEEEDGVTCGSEYKYVVFWDEYTFNWHPDIANYRAVGDGLGWYNSVMP